MIFYKEEKRASSDKNNWDQKYVSIPLKYKRET